MSQPTDFWERCPVCRARLKASRHCPRCSLDFSPMLAAADQARDLAATARSRLKLRRPREAFWEAVRAVRVQRTPQTLKALAITALAKGYFELALAVWRELQDRSGNAVEAAHDL